jgi:thiamine biosynthesis lipoprotein
MKNLRLLLLLTVFGCNPDKKVSIEGETMATSYHVSYFDGEGRDFKKEIDSLLVIVNRSINTYDPTSEISAFNKSEKGIKINLPYFLPPLEKALEVYKVSDGAFDPTVMPLVNAWGFGPERKAHLPDSSKIDSLLTFIGLNRVFIRNDSVLKTHPRVQLDFGGIGQGYGADVIANFLKLKGVENMFVELGGEGLALGHNLETGKSWYIGILDPQDLDSMKAYVSLSDRAFTTSGNYYNYREVNGRRFSHIMDPKTGYPSESAIISASVFAPDCTTADAWAKVLIVSGVEKSIGMLKGHPELNAFLVYLKNGVTETYTTKNISDQLELSK